MPWKTLCVLFLALWAQSGVAQTQPKTEDRSPAELITAWRTADRGERIRIYESLLAEGSGSLPALREAIRTGGFAEKSLAFAVLRDLRNPGAVEELAQVVVTHPSEQVQARAVVVLGEIGAPGALPVIRDLLRQKPSDAIALAALASLGKLGSHHDLSIARGWLHSSDEQVRLQAAIALARLGSPDAEQVILDATASRDSLLQKWAIEALGFLDTAGARARVEEILRDPEALWKSYAWVAHFRQQARRAGFTEKTDLFERLTRHPNRLVREWARQERPPVITEEK